MTRIMIPLTLAACVLLSGCRSMQSDAASDGWISLFDGQTLNGWQASENKDTFSIEFNCIRAKGDRSHLFYAGPVSTAHFKNFEWKADVLTKPGSNSGMYIHTEYQETGWPAKGYEVQVNNTHTDWRKTGGLYGVVDVKEAPAIDDQWFTQHIIVKDSTITVLVDGKVTVEYTEPKEVSQNGQPGAPGRKLSSGTIALQGHDPASTVYFKNILIKPLP